MIQTRRRRRHALPVNAEINITNLVDVAFVLLIIFMITAPILQGGIELTLPKAAAEPLTTSDAVVVSVAADGRIFLDQNPVTLEEFPDVFQGYMGAHEGKPVSFKGDMRAPYGRVMQVFSIMKNLGHENLNILLDPEPAAGRRR